MAARFVWDEEVPGSNPGSPTTVLNRVDIVQLISRIMRLTAGLTATGIRNGLSVLRGGRFALVVLGAAHASNPVVRHLPQRR